MKLFENPNELWYNDEEIEWADGTTLPFSYYNGLLHIGPTNTTHDEISMPPHYRGDARGQYSGRLFFDQKIITFWHFPESREVLKTILKEIKEYCDKYNNAQYKFLEEFQPVNFDDWKVEVPETVEKLKQYPEIYTDEDYPQWSNITQKINYVPVDQYDKGIERSAEELAQEHIKSPLLKGGKEVPQGFGSKHPDAEKKAKEKMNAPFESFYPRLNESPDTIYTHPGQIRYTDREAVPFCAMGKQTELNDNKIISDVWIGDYGYQHNYEYSRVYFHEFPGRLFTKHKVLTMWDYPSKKELEFMVKLLEEKLNLQIFNNGWQIEVDEDEFESLDEYFGHDIQANAPSEEEYQQHMLSPLLKGEKPVTPGFGSKHPKAEDRFKHELAKPFENKTEEHYPRLNENPDAAHINSFDSDDYYETTSYNSRSAYPFGYDKNGEMQIGTAGSTHGQSNIDRYHGLPGRIWMGDEVISFWIYPTRKNIKKVITDIENALKKKHMQNVQIWDNPDFKIEILRDLEPTEFEEGKYPDEKEGGLIQDPYGDWKTRSKVWDVIPLQQYAGSEQPTEEDLKKEHELSPLLKRYKDVPVGFGSKHPKAEQKFKEKLNTPFESSEETEYPRLFETPETVRLKTGGTVNWTSEDGFPFGIKRNGPDDEDFKVGEVHGVHYKLFPPLYRRDLKYPGRVWPREKVISFWTYPETKEELVDILRKIEAHFHMKIIGDPKWQIEILKEMDEDDEDFWNDSYDIIPLTDYVGSAARSEEELNQEHVLSPLLKKSKEIPKGFGSKHPEAEHQFKKKMNAPFEGLNESPDEVWTPAAKIAGTNLGYADPDAYAFRYAFGKLKVGRAKSTHGDIPVGVNITSDDENSGWYEGRIWTKRKIISFWNYPPPDIFKIIIKGLEEKLSIQIFSDSKWKVEVITKGGELYVTKEDEDVWDMIDYAVEMGNYSIKFIHPKDYMGSEDPTERVEHQLSPLLKQDKPVPAGFGSKHPDAEKKFKEKMNQPFENKTNDMKDFYPRLNEKNDPKPPIRKLYEAGGTPTIREALLRLGYAVNSSETTAGAKKYWLIKKESVGPKSWQELIRDLESNGIKTNFYPGDDQFSTMGPELSGNGWKLEQQGGRGADLQNLFLAIYKNRPRGEEYYYGSDV